MRIFLDEIILSQSRVRAAYFKEGDLFLRPKSFYSGINRGVKPSRHKRARQLDNIA
jgi:hypothetical protein